MNWFIRLSQLYPYLFDGSIKCRIINHLRAGKILIETEKGHRFEIYESQFRKRIKIPPKVLTQYPADQLCDLCGHLSRDEVCELCGHIK